MRGITVDLALHGIALLHWCKPVVEFALGQEVRVMASTGLDVNVSDDPVRKHDGLPFQPMHFMMPIITLALKVLVSTWRTHGPDGAVD